MNMLLAVQNITKQYRGTTILESVSFSIHYNQITAILGKNGSGKSTLLKIIAGLITPDSGSLIPSKHPLKIGYVPEVSPSHILFTPREYLEHMGQICGMGKQELLSRINYLLELFHLEDVQDTRIAHFSKGMRQKMMITQAMLNETDLLILDEPLSGLDLKTQSELEQTLLSLKQQGMTILLTCHETKLLDHVVDTTLMIENKEVKEANLSVHHATYNQLIFEISNLAYLQDISPLIEIQNQLQLANGSYEVITHIQAQQTNHLLQQLLYKNVTIKQIVPINVKEKFIQND
ncbi:ABC transporter ATP-binding protein [Lysinibacillus sp. FSL K6-0057]|uniref:ABC transporter ATP-binding protein n=1 Tax=unclassified Lysinibacillus TaxID=2636778 RepID=UPI0031589377